MADYFGGADPTQRKSFNAWTQKDLNIGMAHLIVARISWLASWLFAI